MRKLANKNLYNFKLSKLHFLYLLNDSLRRASLSKSKWLLNRFKNNEYIGPINEIKKNTRWTTYSEKIKRSNKFLVGVRNKIKMKKKGPYLKLKSFKSFKRYDFSIKRRFGFKRIFIFFRLDEKPVYKRRRNTNFKKKLYLYSRRLRFFYGNLTQKGQWKLSQTLKRKKKKIEFDNKIISLENKIYMLLYRLNLVKWPNAGILLLKKGLVTVNKKITRSTMYIVKPYEIIGLKKHRLRNEYLFKLNNSRIQSVGFKPIPNFIEFNYRAFCFTYIPQIYKFSMLNFRFPIKKQLIFGLGKKTI